MISITYNDLVSAIAGGTLTAGEEYNITDYATTAVDTPNNEVTLGNHSFTLVVTALTNSTISKGARAIDASLGYFDADGVKEWQILYDINNNSTLYDWADTANGKGVICYLRDEYGNCAFYDFKNIICGGYYTYGGTTDYSVSQASECKNNRHEYFVTPVKYELSGLSIRSNGFNKILSNDISGGVSQVTLYGGGSSYNTNFACYNKVKGTAEDVELTGSNCEVYNGSSVTIVGNSCTATDCENFTINSSDWVIAKECEEYTSVEDSNNIELNKCSGVEISDSSYININECEDSTIATSSELDVINSDNVELTDANNVAISNSTLINLSNVTNSTLDECDDVTSSSTIDGLNAQGSSTIVISTNITNKLLLDKINTLTIDSNFSTKFGGYDATISNYDGKFLITTGSAEESGINADGTLTTANNETASQYYIDGHIFDQGGLGTYLAKEEGQTFYNIVIPNNPLSTISLDVLAEDDKISIYTAVISNNKSSSVSVDTYFNPIPDWTSYSDGTSMASNKKYIITLIFDGIRKICYISAKLII